MSNLLPLPQKMAEHFKPSALANFSLLLDRGMDQWSFLQGTEGALEANKPEFLKAFATRFRERPLPHFDRFGTRRAETLAALGAELIVLYAQTRLVVGLGLPNPLETGFLLDRLTGCPCLPGSSVKGLLRATARLVVAGDLEEPAPGAKDFWLVNLTRVFGPEIEAGIDPRLGEVVFYDAFPVSWPHITVDVLTPHQSKYYQGDGPPADWNKPVPVPFLTVEKGTAYRFWIGPGERGRETWPADLAQLKPLLTVGLDVLGIGGKKAAGYGVFGEQKTPEPVKAAPPRSSPAVSPRPAPPPSVPAETKEWPEVELGWHQRSPAAFRGDEVATCSQEVLPADLLKALKNLKKKTKLIGTVEVRRIFKKDLRIVAVSSWRQSEK